MRLSSVSHRRSRSRDGIHTGEPSCRSGTPWLMPDGSQSVGTVVSIFRTLAQDGHGPQFQDWGGGLVFITNDGISAQGNPIGNRIVARRDGRDYPIASRAQIAFVTVAFEVTNAKPWSANYTIKVDGNVTQSATESISRDGQKMTVSIEGMGADGPYTETQVWVKQ